MQLALPNDVLLLIGEQLERKTDRWNLILVSHQFHDLFLSLVYRKVSLHDWQDADSFLHAILKRPALARTVRELDVTEWRAKGLSDNDCRYIQTSPALVKWLDSVAHSKPESNRWSGDLKHGLVDAWVALILPLLSQLRKLQLAYGTSSPYLERIMERVVNCEKPFSIQPAFRYLRNVSLYHREDLDHSENRENVEDGAKSSSTLLLPFFQLPSVRSITANSVVDFNSTAITTTSEGTEEDKDQYLGFSSITEIDLHASSGNHGMEMLVASCADLKSFKYQHSDSNVLSHGYQPSAFYRSLCHSKHSLQTLWLDHYGSHHPFTAAGLNQTHDEWFGSLIDFTALRELRIRLPNLLDIRYQNEPTTPLTECLPSSLETLYIEGCEARHLGMLVSQLQTVIKNRRVRFPKLERIDIEGAFRNATSDDDDDLSASSGSEIHEAGIKDKVYQVAEPLHMDCLHAGMGLHLHDRALSRI
ncbi:hypothetical protein N7457_002853 [Penicillium paradoxum]|uniref:uncharacterized protein n=1 Tax=Penicillium paradoxum TaxID=176176 RepID=UPI002546E603|nr:uncharacterized protein N7457_002853 [Penicillium paradoxum]KAJ5787863.1 hypothetical protein N7457_002853 [Penicillium paradoxum]